MRPDETAPGLRADVAVIGVPDEEMGEVRPRLDQRVEVVAADPALDRTGVEEVVRWVSPVTWMRRTATQDGEINGHAFTAAQEAARGAVASVSSAIFILFAVGALIGPVMKATRGQADAGRVREIVLERVGVR